MSQKAESADVQQKQQQILCRRRRSPRMSHRNNNKYYVTEGGVRGCPTEATTNTTSQKAESADVQQKQQQILRLRRRSPRMSNRSNNKYYVAEGGVRGCPTEATTNTMSQTAESADVQQKQQQILCRRRQRHGGVDVQLGGGYLHPRERPRDTHRVGRWVGPRVYLLTKVQKNFSLSKIKAQFLGRPDGS
jgi:hypothetical protein